MDDPFNHIGHVPRKPGPAAAYQIELLESASLLANVSDLPNSSAMLAAAAKLVDQECRVVTNAPPPGRTDA